MILAKIFFFSSIFLLFYVYAGYPLFILVLGRIANRKVRKSHYEPTVTILISAYNEEKWIEATIQNKLKLDYPRNKFEILIVSDGSTDSTDFIVSRYQTESVRLLRQEPRQGKTAALNMAVGESRGEILVFSDANSIYKSDALKKIVQNFSDPKVGYITGKMIFQNPDGSGIGDGCSTYMKYENFLREMETNIGSIVGVDGGIDAVRRSLYKPMNPDQLPDFILPLKVIEQGYRVVYEQEAILIEPSLQTSEDEYRMRVRVSLRALWALRDMKQLLSVGRFKLFAWQLWSHKVLRYGCFIFLVVAYISNLALWNEHAVYKLLFILQTIIYGIFSLQLWFGNNEYRSKILRLIHYFMLLNLASAHASIKFLLGKKQVLWTPRKG
jgi:cellulose synthase/poly-beta-1,6-N-acetylglucosamine synthase-like glycosyltransferase